MKPTAEFYTALQVAYDHFNLTLFKEELPQVIFTTQRQKGMMGYFSPDRWGSDNGKQCHEIAINPLYVGSSTLIELMQTLVHEMAHCWQYCKGKPSQRAYHNKEWSNKMVSIGLIPSTTGKPGGKLVGQHMNDYLEPKGLFITECINLLRQKQFRLPWVDKYSLMHRQPHSIKASQSLEITNALADVDDELATQLTTGFAHLFDEAQFEVQRLESSKKVKSKYSCSDCGINVWGKSDLSLRCEDCDNIMDEY